MLDNTPYLEGFYRLPSFDKQKLQVLLDAQKAAGVTYGYGSKDPTPKNCIPIDYKAIDCSGEARELVYFATNGLVFLPDGSWNQGQWFAAQGCKRSTFANTGLIDQVVRACVYHNPSGVGHIWLTYNGVTFESHGGVGPSNRHWDDPVLAGIAGHTDIYCVG